MADAAPSPAPVLNPDAEYKPVSGLALASIVVAGLYAAILLGLVAVGFLTKRPIDEGWHLWLAAAGLVLAYLAKSQIRRADGMRIGLSMANAAWWICLVGGGGFFAYLQANEASLKLQSGKFLDNWFDALRKGDQPGSFILSLDPELQRDPSLTSADPALEERLENEFPMFNNYRALPLVQAISRSGEPMKVSRQGLGRWKYATAATELEWTCRLSSPEGIALATVSMKGARLKGEKALTWRIDVGGRLSVQQENVTTYGRLVGRDLNAVTIRSLSSWLAMTRLPVSDNQFSSYKWLAYFMTLPPDRREAFLTKARDWANSQALGIGAFTLPDEPEMFAPPADFFRTADRKPASGDELKLFRRVWQFDGFGPATGPNQRLPEFTFSDDGVRVRYPVEFTTPFAGDRYRGMMVAKLIDEKVVEQLNRLRKECAANPSSRDDGTLLASILSVDSWQILYVESNLKPVVMKKDVIPH